MDISYFIKIQNAYGTNNRRERELAKVNRDLSKHFEDTFDTENVLLNGKPFSLMIVKDSDNNTFKKKIKSAHEYKFNLGDYVQWNNQIWIVTLVDPDEKTWNRGYMYLCTIPLRWQNSNGKIVERYGYSEDFTKYSSGKTGNNNITIGDNQYGITVPIDNETKMLERDTRFVIDFDSANKPDVYKLTNKKSFLNNNEYFGRGGTIILTMSYDSFNASTDKRIKIDENKNVWICDYKMYPSTLLPSIPSDTDEESYLIKIKGASTVKIGASRLFTAEVLDHEENPIDWDDTVLKWFVNGPDGIVLQQTKNKMAVSINDDSLIGKTFDICIKKNEIIICSKTLQIVEGF